ncbi:MAG: mono/diheme cytochrome c family protein [Paraglaciecola sp.]|jgi:mono/diheme cytochrome c family protein
MKLLKLKTNQLVASSAIALLILTGCGEKKDSAQSTNTAGIKQTTVEATPALIPVAKPIVHLEQGWTKDEALDFYFTSQGSHLMPYAWFLVLEQHNNNQLFRNDKNIKKFGYIPQDKITGINPDGLPIGFVKDDRPDEFLSRSLTRDRLSSNAATNEWLGLTCAGCHTSEIVFDQQTLRINGGPPLSDMQSLLQNLSKALIATSENDEKMARFAKNVLAQGGHNAIEQQALKEQVVSFTNWLDGYIGVNYSGLTTPYGYGRLDAFGAILNRVSSSLLNIPTNGTPANAPVSFPFLWNTSQLDWVQWNGSVNNHIGRNVGEVTGVFAHTVLDTTDDNERFYSSGKIINLDRLEQLMSKLDSPKWGAPLPAIAHDRADRGKALFASNCANCHGVSDEQGLYPMTAPNIYGKQFIEISMTPLADIGTDPLTAMNFVNPKLDADPGAMRKYIAGYMMQQAKKVGKSEEEIAAVGKDYSTRAKVPRGLILTVAGGLIINKQMSEFKPALDDMQKLELVGFREERDAPNLIAYKARPLNGIWATAPYMHNGSMANLYQTLLPEDKRETSFYVGSNKFDSELVGFKTPKTGNQFLYKTDAVGNSNAGHSGDSFTKTLGQDGQWRDFTDAERFELIEYMKTL